MWSGPPSGSAHVIKLFSMTRVKEMKVLFQYKKTYMLLIQQHVKCDIIAAILLRVDYKSLCPARETPGLSEQLMIAKPVESMTSLLFKYLDKFTILIHTRIISPEINL